MGKTMKQYLLGLALIYFNFSLIFSYSNSTNETSTCKILALEGGGDKGAYQAGVLKGFMELLPRNSTDYDIVSGISVGSLNGMAMAIYPKGSEKDAVDFMLDVWLKIKGKSDILADHIKIPFIGKYLGPAYGAIFGESIYDSTPLKNLLTERTKGRKIQRDYIFGATSIRSGEYLRFTNLTQEQLVGGLLSSSAVPGIFPPVHYKNDTFVDGGVSYFFDLTSAVKMCQDKGFKNEQIIIDLIRCSTYDIEHLGDNMKTIDILFQTFDILSANFMIRDLLTTVESFPGINIRYFISPSEQVSSSIPINFDPKDIRKSIAIGEKDAKDNIKQGEGVKVRKILSDYRKEVEKQLKILKDY